MFRQLVSHNPDLSRLADAGYAVGFDTNHLVVRDIPYLDAVGALAWGALVTKLEFVDQYRVQQTDHQVFFAGGMPHALAGTPIPNLGGGAATVHLSERAHDVVVQRSFSNKPIATGRFADFFEKIESYVAIISGPAIERFGVTPLTRRRHPDAEEDPIFLVPDTLTTRAGIGDLAARLGQETVAIIGLGGTGSYVLDLIIKSPVRAVRAFDHDSYCVHNSYRSPGRLDLSELGTSKADVYSTRYANFRRNLSIERAYIDRNSTARLDGVTFAFVCVDDGEARSAIFDVLISQGISFIDVGMGLNRRNDALNGLLRVTLFPHTDADRIRALGLADTGSKDNDAYRDNIQIAELNALNASLAVVLFKQHRGFYYQDAALNHLVFELADLKIVSDVN